MDRTHRQPRLERSFVVATASHLAAVAAFALAVPRGASPPAPAPSRLEGAIVEVSVDDDVRRAGAVGFLAAPRIGATPAGAGRLQGWSERSGVLARERTNAGPPVVAPALALKPGVLPTAGGDSQPWTFQAAPATTRPLASSGARELRALPAAGLDSPGAGAVASVLGGLDAHDRRVGLSPGGALVAAAGDVVRAGRTPPKSHAQIEVRTDEAGVVTAVRVLEASSDMDAWDDVAKRLVASMRGRPLRVPPGARGLVVTLRVDSSVRRPSGHEVAPETASGAPAAASSAGVHGHVGVSPLGVGLFVDTDPTDMLLDATSLARRVVSVSVASEERR